MKRLILIAMVVLLSVPNVFAQNFCKGDFNYNGSVGAEDVSVFLEHFGRSQYNNPCPPDGPAPVPRTGQTMSYTPSDDGDLLRGVEWPVPRFTDNSDGTVTDHLTGLIWLKNANCFGLKTWNQAITDCHNLGVPDCDLTDGSSAGTWRLPNIRELFSMVDFNYNSPALHPEALLFTNVQSTNYWSSTTNVFDSSFSAWYLSLFDGFVFSNDKALNYYVWPVRGGH